MPSWTLAFLLGISSLFGFKYLPDSKWCYYLLPLALVATSLPSKYYLRLPCAILLGFCWALFHANAQLTAIIPTALEGKTLTVIGIISSLPEQQDRSTHFEFSIQTINFNQQHFSLPKHIRLSWYNNMTPIHVGDEWQLQVRLKKPRSTFNPGGFDYEGWLFEHRIGAVGYVVDGKNNYLINRAWYQHPIDQLRGFVDRSITTALHDSSMKGLIAALVVGDRSAITPEQWQVLQGTGTNHLMAIAGLHIGFVASFIYWIILRLWRISGRLCLYIPAPQVAGFFSLLAAFMYSAMAGFALPTERAVIMIAVFLIATLLRKNLPAWHAWSLALLVILLLDPLATLADSFWLSFGAVAVIIYGVSGRIGKPKLGWHWGRTQWVVGLGLVPLTLLFFHQISLTCFVANAIAIPWVGFVVLPLSLLASLLLPVSSFIADHIFIVTQQAMAWLWPLLSWLASLHDLQWQKYIQTPWLFITAMIGILLLLAPRGIPGRWLGGIWLLPLVFWLPSKPATGTVWFTLLDVGQGLSAVLQTKEHTLVFDTGVKLSDSFDMGQAVVVPFLRYSGINQVDKLVISHGDNDHIGGAASVIKQMQVREVLTSVPERFAPGLAKPCTLGESWWWDNVYFEFLYPPLGQKNLDNDNSCVLRVSVGKQHILLTGDIEKFSEKYLVKNKPLSLPADILVAPHHGSRTSSTQNFLQAVHPQFVLLPVGYRNRYRLPSVAIVNRYRELGSILYDTAKEGAISFVISGQASLFTLFLERKVKGHYWNRWVE